jgi:ABC-type transport system involved in multi-copper enzyme maturation permease subunit
MNSPWSFILSGIVFCLAGIFLFQRNAFEENRKILFPLLVVAAGIVLISIGMAKKLQLID